MIEADVLKDVIAKIHSLDLPYMLTGSWAMSFYTLPRMTRDIDIVIEIYIHDVDKFMEVFSKEYYVEKNAILESIKYRSMFNIIHNLYLVKVDFIVRKNEEYRLNEFKRKKNDIFEGQSLKVVSIEDLILSKLEWVKVSESEYQKRDIVILLQEKYDKDYLITWAKKIGVYDILEKLL
ncbi:MAG: hypothetical protein ABSG15_04950 [FCB group bacterium]|jgi:hypothetical protein